MRCTLWIASVVLAAACGCQSTPEPDTSRDSIERRIKDGVSTRQELLNVFGTPTGSYERGRILTYRLAKDYRTEQYILTRRWVSGPNPFKAGYYGTYWGDDPVSLVLVFDASNRVSKHAVVGVQP